MAAPVAKSAHQSEAIDRQINDWDLAGLTSVEIAARLAALAPPIVMTDRAVRARIARLNQRAVIDREAMIQHELRVLSFAERKTVEALDQVDADAVAPAVTALRGVSESRRKLLGLDAPAKQEVTGADGGPIRIIEALAPPNAEDV